MRFHSFCPVIVLLLIFNSCSSMPTKDIEIINEQAELINFLEGIVYTQDIFSIEAFSRKTFSPRTKQTKLMTHSFYLINLCDGRYFTLSFSNANLKIYKFYDDGIWILNKTTDINSYNLYIKGKNIWNVDYLHAENLIDEYQTINNIISSINSNAKYCYKDHIKDKPNYYNCNSALNETIAFRQCNSALSDLIAYEQ